MPAVRWTWVARIDPRQQGRKGDTRRQSRDARVERRAERAKAGLSCYSFVV